jgi:hypothetical protein
LAPQGGDDGFYGHALRHLTAVRVALAQYTLRVGIDAVLEASFATNFRTDATSSTLTLHQFPAFHDGEVSC